MPAQGCNWDGMRLRISGWCLAAILCLSPAARAAIPAPGQHSIRPKYWATFHRWVTDFSPYAFDSSVNALLPDGHGGVWFAIGSSLERVTSGGEVRIVYDSHEWLWEIWGLARDAHGRVWFSLGQSGRIGEVEPDGRIRIRSLVPRSDFPDIRQIAFAPDGSLWFSDVGRSSIGVRSPDGLVREIPTPKRDLGTFAYCNGKAWVAESGVVYESDPRLSAFMQTLTQRSGDFPFISCDAAGDLWFARSSWQGANWAAGFIDVHGSVHRVSPGFDPTGVFAGDDGAVYFTGVLHDGNGYRTIVARFVHGRLAWRRSIPDDIAYGMNMTATPDGTIWIGTRSPQAILRAKNIRQDKG